MAVFTAIAAALTITVGQLALMVASVAYQIYQSKKMRKAARDAAEARKGFELVIEGSVQALPIIYGRAKVGGVRVYSDTTSQFKHVASTAGKSFNVGIPATEGVVVPSWKFETGGYKPSTEVIPPAEDGLLQRDLAGSKNEFLFTQQALCIGPIHAVHDLLVNDLSLNEPTLVSGSVLKPKAAFRAEVYYGDSVACPLMTANAGHRATAKFPNAAFLTAVVRLDRDNPQFSSVPDVQALIEGRLVRSVMANNTLGPRAYSNNGALCLLDYLLETESGGNISVDELDLESLRLAAAVCDKIVLQHAAVGGAIWQPSDNARSIATRDIRLYETNVIIDTTKPVRSNIEALLSCMGDARLVWSQGRYKLLVQYPEYNEAAEVAGELTDNDLVLDDDVEVAWPSASDRLNCATVRFHDESSNFKENSVSWPPKVAGVYPRGIGVRTYSAIGGWDDKSDRNRMLNALGVWRQGGQTASMKWTFFCKAAGTYTFKFVCDDNGSGSINGTPFSSTYGDGIKTIAVAISANSIVTINVTVVDTGGAKGFAGTLTSPTSLQIWSSRSPAYDSMELINQTSGVYDTYLAEDNGLQLETDVFGEGVTDYYHALAKAEELVRTSRSAFIMKFRYFIRGHYFEPGDIIRLRSDVLKIPDLLLRVNEASVEDGLIASLTCARFDYTQLAWNVDDNQAGQPTSVWTTPMPAPAWATYTPGASTLGGSPGRVEWASVIDARLSHYRIFFHAPGDVVDTVPQFRELGISYTDTFDLPALAAGAGVFGVAAVADSGQTSAITYTGRVLLEKGPTPPTPTGLTAISATGQSLVSLTWAIPREHASGAPYLTHMSTLVWRNTTNDFASAKVIGQSANNEYQDTLATASEVYYWVQLVSQLAVPSVESAPAGPVTFFIDSSALDPSAEPPPPTFNLAAEAGLTFFYLTWKNANYGVGGGPRAVRIYGALTKPGLTLADYKLLIELTGETYFFPADLGKEWSFIARSVSRAGGLSTAYAGPVVAKTGKIGNVDLSDNIIEAHNIANNSITNQKLIPGLEGIVYRATLPLTDVGATISVAGILHKWTGAGYVPIVNAVDLSGVITSNQIADAALTTAKFAQGLAPVELVAVLPTVDNFVGRIVSVTADGGAIYHYTATGWSSNVPPGSIAGTHIANNAITTPKIQVGSIDADRLLANSITAGQIKAGTITATEIATRSIYADRIASGAITANEIGAYQITAQKIASGAITADKIQGNSITADRLQANSITAGQIATGAITADKLAVGSITAGSAAVAYGAITNAMIGNAAITSAKIADLSVGTLKIMGNAVTVPLHAYGGHSGTGNLNTTRQLCRIYYDGGQIPVGTSVLITVTVHLEGAVGSGRVDLYLQAGSTGAYANGWWQQINAGQSVCVTISDLLTANSSGNFFNFGHTSQGTAGVSMSIGMISMTIMAAKR